MSSLILPNKWTSQPQYPVEIDWSNPLARGLVVANTPFTKNNIVTNDAPVLNTGVSVTVDGISTYTATSGLLGWGISTSSNYTFLSFGKFRVGAARISAIAASGANQTLYFDTLNTGSIKLYKYNGSYPLMVDTGIIGVEGQILNTAVTSNASGVSVFINGKSAGSTATTLDHTNINQAGFIYRQGATTYPDVLKGLGFFLAFNRTLSALEIKSLSDNPWQIFKSQSRRIWVVGAGGGVSLSLTGQSLTANLGALSASVTSSVTGNQTTLQQGTITANVSQTLTGQAISLVQGSVSSDVSTVITGQTVSLAQGSVTDASSGNVTKALSGQSLSVSQGALTASISLALNGQSIVLSGGAVSSLVSSALTGQQASVQQGILSANVSAGLTGQAVVISNGTVAQAGSDVTKALTGQQLSIALGVLLEKKTIARPSSDTTAGAWLPSAGSSLYATLDEVSPDDADYIYTNSVSTCKIALNAVTDPLTSSGQIVSYRVWSPNSDGLTVRLMQGTTEIASWTHTVLPTSPTTYQQALTAGQCDAITDYSTLAIQLESV